MKTISTSIEPQLEGRTPVAGITARIPGHNCSVCRVIHPRSTALVDRTPTEGTLPVGVTIDKISIALMEALPLDERLVESTEKSPFPL